jgi:TonB family protein
MCARLLFVIVAAGSLTIASVFAQNAPANIERPNQPANQRSVFEGIPAWQKALVVHIEKYKRYPYEAKLRRVGGTAVIEFKLDRSGHVVLAKVLRSSGDNVLDDAALATVRGADPVPPPPQSVSDTELTFSMPIRFVVR